MKPESPTPIGLIVPPCWHILEPEQPVAPGRTPLFLAPGPGWGTGAHETTRLCLQAIHALAPRERSSWSMLDFGAGSGLLALAAARRGARVSAVEIDPDGLEHGRRNAELNGLSAQVTFSPTLPERPERFELIVANILRHVLVAHADALASRLETDGLLVLSGLVGTDIPELSLTYAARLEGRRPAVYRAGPWCALVWAPERSSRRS